MLRVRPVPETSLFVISGLIEPELARDFQAEWVEQLLPAKRQRLETVREIFFNEDYSVASIRDRSDVPATQRVLKLLGLDGFHDAAVGLNFQSPRGEQNFHHDNRTFNDTVYVVHGADGGAFDYAPDATTTREAEETCLSIEVSAGDVMLQTQQTLMHRGRNTSELPRVTAAIARVDFNQFYDSYYE